MDKSNFSVQLTLLPLTLVNLIKQLILVIQGYEWFPNLSDAFIPYHTEAIDNSEITPW
jgi:hypothetical protein